MVQLGTDFRCKDIGVSCPAENFSIHKGGLIPPRQKFSQHLILERCQDVFRLIAPLLGSLFVAFGCFWWRKNERYSLGRSVWKYHPISINVVILSSISRIISGTNSPFIHSPYVSNTSFCC